MKIKTFLSNDKETFENEINSFVSTNGIDATNTYITWNGVYFGVVEYTGEIPVEGPVESVEVPVV